MTNTEDLKSGELYSLSQLFSSNNRIVIPDLQRDYCWGDSVHTEIGKELVTGFVDGMIKQFQENTNENLNLGLIYGYEEPKNYIQLCDGQQRITTLFLLIGMLNHKLENNAFKDYLISPVHHDSYLQYAIRESSLYFLNDLVAQFFIHNDTPKLDTVDSISSISNEWYFNEYKLDPTIQSMLKALKIIETILDKCSNDSMKNFGEFLITNLEFMYYDMGNRKNGEETFVVINTTGEPLSMTQNLKPLVIKAAINIDCKEVANKWEEIETWFWQKRKGDNDTSEAGFQEFLRWVTLLELAKEDKKEELNTIFSTNSYEFPVESISFDCVYNYWIIVKCIYEFKDADKIAYTEDFLSPQFANNSRYLTQIDIFTILPVIAYCEKWNAINESCLLEQTTSIDIRRIYEYFVNLSRYQSINISNSSIYNALRTIQLMDGKDILCLLDIQNISSHILTNEEKLKLEIFKEHDQVDGNTELREGDKLTQRNDIENLLWDIQDGSNFSSKIWNGQIKTLIQWSLEDGKFNLESLKKYTDIFSTIFNGEDRDSVVDLDLFRRALLAMELKDYPRIFRGNTNYSFAYNSEDWKKLINENVDVFGTLFGELIDSDYMKNLNDKITNYPIDKFYSDFVHNEGLLRFCEQKNIRIISPNDIRLLRRFSITGYHLESKSYCYYLNNHENIKQEPFTDFDVLVSYGANNHPGFSLHGKLLDDTTYRLDIRHSYGGEEADKTNYELCFYSFPESNEIKDRKLPNEMNQAIVEVMETQAEFKFCDDFKHYFKRVEEKDLKEEINNLCNYLKISIEKAKE